MLTSTLAGRSPAQWRPLCEQFLHEVVTPRIPPAAHALVTGAILLHLLLSMRHNQSLMPMQLERTARWLRAVGWFVLAGAWATSGRALGMAFVGLRVVSADGHPLKRGQSRVRAVDVGGFGQRRRFALVGGGLRHSSHGQIGRAHV